MKDSVLYIKEEVKKTDLPPVDSNGEQIQDTQNDIGKNYAKRKNDAITNLVKPITDGNIESITFSTYEGSVTIDKEDARKINQSINI